jgi:hypothetical protein
VKLTRAPDAADPAAAPTNLAPALHHLPCQLLAVQSAADRPYPPGPEKLVAQARPRYDARCPALAHYPASQALAAGYRAR